MVWNSKWNKHRAVDHAPEFQIRTLPFLGAKLTVLFVSPYTTRSFHPFGQVAQSVERGPEKAGVGGSIPSLATNKTGEKGKGEREKRYESTCPFPLYPFPLFILPNSA